MATQTLAGAFGEIRAASTAGGGTALTTTPQVIQLPNGTARVFLMPRNYTTAAVVKIAKCPYLYIVRTQDNFATATDLSQSAQDGNASTYTNLHSQDTAANGDYLLVGSWMPFRGVAIDVNQANANASVLTVEYWGGEALGGWVDFPATDGTASGGATFAVDGNVTWADPNYWTTGRLSQIVSGSAQQIPYAAIPNLFWTRWRLSAALDSSVRFASMVALAFSTSYAEWTSGVVIEDAMVKGPGHWAALEALTDAGTANVIVNAATMGDSTFALPNLLAL